MNNKLLAQYGLKFNPFIPDVPIEALYRYPQLEEFCWCVEHSFMRDGGFALISGEPGTGKSVTLRILANELTKINDIQIGVLTRPSASLGDFYRELGEIFNISLQYNNRWNSFKQLRERWMQHLQTTLCRAVIFIDEAQDMNVYVLNELRLLTSTQFDSRLLLNIIFAGDHRLDDKLRYSDLVALGSRIRTRFYTEQASPTQLLDTLKHLLTAAGNPCLMSEGLMKTVCEHALGNYRAMCIMSGELLTKAAKKEQAQLDEKLYFECFAKTSKPSKRK
jgi:general secretion pathway protein A